MGFGHALFEETVYQDGQLLNADPFQYRLPTMQDIPEHFRTIIPENEDGPGPLRLQGMSQTRSRRLRQPLAMPFTTRSGSE
jgi:CO/xanthine dehydrogenase Mo-binding subunit